MSDQKAVTTVHQLLIEEPAQQYKPEDGPARYTAAPRFEVRAFSIHYLIIEGLAKTPSGGRVAVELRLPTSIFLGLMNAMVAYAREWLGVRPSR